MLVEVVCLIRLLAAVLLLERPEKWGDYQVGFRGSSAFGGRIVLLPGAFWAGSETIQEPRKGTSKLGNVLL